MRFLPLHSAVSTSSRSLRKKSCSCQNDCSRAWLVLTGGKASRDSWDVGEGWQSDSTNPLEQWPFSPLWHCWMGWWSAGWCGALGRRADTASGRHRCSCVWSVWWRCSPQEIHGWHAQEMSTSYYWSQGCRNDRCINSIKYSFRLANYIYIALTSVTIDSNELFFVEVYRW